MREPAACPSEDRLIDYVDGRLDAANEAAIDAHLDGCSECTAVLAGLAVPHTTLGPPGATTSPLVGGTRLGRYVLRAPLGAGAMGVVYDAFDPDLGRSVAIKLVHARGATRNARASVLREAQALARLSDPGVVPVLAAGVHEDDVFVVMERIAGTTARAWLRAAPRRWTEVVRIYLAAARALASAHAAGVVHRDFKPDNVMVGDDGRVRVIDFGLARIAAAPASATVTTADGDLERSVAGLVVGTPAYMPPEQLLDAAVDARADQFALAVSLWEGLYGQRPFTAGSLASLVSAVEHGRVRTPRRRNPAGTKGSAVPSRLRAVLERALSARPEQRFADMNALVAAIERASRSTLHVLVPLAALVGGALVLAFALPRSTACVPEQTPRWDATARAQLAQAVGRTEHASRLDALTRSIDRRHLAWLEAFEQLCAAGGGRVEAAAFSCLEVRRLELDATIDLLIDADPEVLVRAGDVVARLPAVGPCASSDPRLALVDPSSLVEEAAELRGRLARARVLGDAGRFDEAIALTRAVHDRAHAIGHVTVRVEAGWRLGALLILAGAFADSFPLLETAYFDAREVGHDEAAAGAALELVEVLGPRLARIDDVRPWVAHAEAALERWGSVDGEVDLLRKRGMIAQREGNYADALALHERSLALLRTIAASDDPRIGRGLDDIGTDYHLHGDHERALATHLRALEMREQAYGPDHLFTGYSLNNIAMVLVELDMAGAALDHYEWVLEIHRDAVGPEHILVAASHNNIGALWGRLAEPLPAAEAFAAALPGFERLGADHPDLEMALMNLGYSALDAGDLGAAEHALRRSLAIADRRGEGATPEARAAAAGLGRVLASAGAHAEAVLMLERAFAGGGVPQGHDAQGLEACRATLAASRLALTEE